MLVWIMTVMFMGHNKIVCAQYGTCLMLPFWCQEFGHGN